METLWETLSEKETLSVTVTNPTSKKATGHKDSPMSLFWGSLLVFTWIPYEFLI